MSKIQQFKCTSHREKSISPVKYLYFKIFSPFFRFFKLREFCPGCRIRFHFSGDTMSTAMRHSAYSVHQSTNLQFAHMLACTREFTSSGVVVYSNTRERTRPSFRWLNFRPFRRAAPLKDRLYCVSMWPRRKFISHLETSPLTFMVLKQ